MISIQTYSADWPITFEKLKAIYTAHVGEFLLSIEHVGSTSVPGLAAKPVIDIDLVIEDNYVFDSVVAGLYSLGYRHVGDLGIVDRAAFKRDSEFVPIDGSGTAWPGHNLYVCPQYSLSLKNHLTLRDFLRTHPAKAHEYGNLKKDLAAQYPDDVDAYVEMKSPIIASFLKEAGFGLAELKKIEEANKKKY